MQLQQLTKQAYTTQLEATILIDAARPMVWAVVREIGDIARFHPLLRDSCRLNETEGIGAQRHCKMKPMGEMEEKVIDWREENGFTTKVVGGKMLPPCDFMYGDLRLEAVGQKTRVSFGLIYRIKYGILGHILDSLFFKPQFRSAPRKYVEGLKEYLETS